MEIHLIPGSFNPLHIGHRRIYEHAKIINTNVYYELSIHRVEKPPLSENDISERIRQFSWYAPVIVTDASLFKDKVRLPCLQNFKKIYIHCGEDTAQRFVHMNKPEEFDERFGMYVYERCVDGEFRQLNSSWAWPCMIPVNDWGREVAHLSSTELRSKGIM